MTLVSKASVQLAKGRRASTAYPLLALMTTSFVVACGASGVSSEGTPEGGNGEDGTVLGAEASAEPDVTVVASDGPLDGKESEVQPPGGDADAPAGSDAGADGDGGSAPFRVFMIASTAPTHMPMSTAAVPVVEELGLENKALRQDLWARGARSRMARRSSRSSHRGIVWGVPPASWAPSAGLGEW